MASVYYLFDDAVHTEGDIVVKYRNQEYVSMNYYFAAVAIQRTYRGYATRKIIKKCHAAATMIQKMVRGWLVRFHLPDIMHEYYDQMCLDCYTNGATKIQTIWKGYCARKLFSFGDIIKEREEIATANEKIKAAFQECAVEHHEMQDLDVAIRIMKVLFDRHHLLRTHQSEGVFSNHDTKELSELEKILQSVKWKDYMVKLRKYYNRYSQNQKEYQYMFEDKELRKLEDLWRHRDRSEDVRDDYYEESRFCTGCAMKTKIDPEPYDRWITATGKFTLPITKIVRTDEKSKNICQKDFDLHVLKKFVKEADVPPYYIDFWYEQCRIHNFSES